MASEYFEINLNDYVQVRLTPAGELAWAQSWRNTSPEGVPAGIRASADKGDGWFQFHLHEVMNIFGHLCYLGNNDIPFATEIRVRPS